MKKILWSNTNIELTQEVLDFYKEEYPDIYNKGEETMLEDYTEMVNNEYQDFYYEIDRQLEGDILCIANLGLWNGRYSGYKILGDNLNNITSSVIGDYVEFYYDGYNVRASDTHHDGTNHYIYRVIREDRNIDNLLDKIYRGEKISNATLNYYTKSLRNDLKEVLGI